MSTLSTPPSPQGALILAALRDAVRKNLERKRRLGHYAVVWQDGKALRIGEDSPQYTLQPEP